MTQKKVYAPDVLPNNLRHIREMRGLSISRVHKGLNIDRNFLAAVEMENKNFSGKTTIKVLKYYDINFYKMYDVGEKRVLPTTDYFLKPWEVELYIDAVKMDERKDIRSVILERLNDLAAKEGKMGKIEDYKVLYKDTKDGQVHLKLDVEYYEKETRDIEYDINFMENENRKLADMLEFTGFADTIYTMEVNIDNKRVKLDGNKVILPEKYKIPYYDDIKDYYETNQLVVDGERIRIINDKSTGKPSIVKFKVVGKEINNLKAVRTLTKKSIEDMHKALGLTYNGYVNLELGNQKISSKVMWRLVYMLKVPLEVIINVDEYYKRYSAYDKKIEKKRPR